MEETKYESPDRPLLSPREQQDNYNTFEDEAAEYRDICDRQSEGDYNRLQVDLASIRSFLAKTNSDEPIELAIDMFLSSIDISFFTLPLVFHTMGFVLAAGFFFYLLFFGLMASQCYVELKKLSRIARKNNSSRDYVGLMDLIDECCSEESTRFMNPRMLYLVEIYLKIVVVSTLVMLQACNQCFISVII